MKKKILIISGGISKEREISLQTGNQVAKELKNNKYTVKICEPNHNLFEVIKKFKPNTIFNALHGQYGEDGYIQSILENIGIDTDSGYDNVFNFVAKPVDCIKYDVSTKGNSIN